jgi:hypothetical protein
MVQFSIAAGPISSETAKITAETLPATVVAHSLKNEKTPAFSLDLGLSPQDT